MIKKNYTLPNTVFFPKCKKLIMSSDHEPGKKKKIVLEDKNENGNVRIYTIFLIALYTKEA